MLPEPNAACLKYLKTERNQQACAPNRVFVGTLARQHFACLERCENNVLERKCYEFVDLTLVLQKRRVPLEGDTNVLSFRRMLDVTSGVRWDSLETPVVAMCIETALGVWKRCRDNSHQQHIEQGLVAVDVAALAEG
jgi:hypothetical protein